MYKDISKLAKVVQVNGRKFIFSRNERSQTSLKAKMSNLREYFKANAKILHHQARLKILRQKNNKQILWYLLHK